MKRKSKASNSLVTKDHLKKELKSLENRLDKKLNLMDQKNHNAQRSLEIQIVSSALDLRQRLEKTIQAHIEITSMTLLAKIDKKISKFTDPIVTTVDPLLKELETRQQDRALTAHQISEVRGRVDEHEQRLTNLETANAA